MIKSTIDSRQDDIMTPEEVARRLKVDKYTLANWRAKNLGPTYFKYGGPHSKVGYYRSDVEGWLASRVRVAPMAPPTREGLNGCF